MIITLDGPSGSGKSTLAAKLAQKLGFFYLNSGFLYRALAYILVHYYQYTQEQLHNLELADIVEIFDPQNFEYVYQDGKAFVIFKGDDITSHLKNVEISKYASLVALHPFSRQAIVPFQRNYAKTHDMVCDGRDGGTIIFPHADFKFFVVADEQIRAQRLIDDEAKKGNSLVFEKALEKVQARDLRDQTRKVAPLRQAEDAVVIDTSKNSVEETLQILLKKIKK